MAVGPWVTGPNFVFVEFPPGNTTETAFLGTAAYCPKPEIERAWAPIPSSFGGLVDPQERAGMGQQADIFMVLSRWDEIIHHQAASFPGDVNVKNFIIPGTYDGTATGLLFNAQECGLGIHIVFPYQTTYKGMPKGYRFVNCTLVGDDLLEEGGSEGRMLGLRFEAHSIYDEESNVWTLYDFDVAPVPTPR